MEINKILNSKNPIENLPKEGKNAVVDGQSANDFLNMLMQLESNPETLGSNGEIDTNLLKQLMSQLSSQELIDVKQNPTLSPELKLLLEQQTPIVINPSSEEELLNLLDLKNISGKEKVERSPSIDFSPEEIDPKLMSFEDFLAQKNAVTKKVTSSQGYGIPQNKNLLAQMNPEVVEASNMKKPLIDGKMNSLVLNQSSSTELNPIPNSLMNNNQSLSPLTNTQTSQKVFDLSQLQNTSQDQIISQIKDYIVQAKTASEPTVNMKVQHQDLGMIDITVQKMPQEAIQIAIQTSSQDAKLFLNTHQRDLVQSLNQTGIQVSDLKIDSSSSLGKANADSSGQQQGFDQSSSGKQFGSENNQRQQDSQRRNELWKFLEEKEVA